MAVTSQMFGVINDPATSDYLKAFISQNTDNGSVLVIGYISEGTAEMLQSQWESPFEQDTVGSIAEKASGLAQATSGRTSKTKFNSQQVWHGTLPVSLTLNLQFKAYSDAQNEVDMAIAHLKAMASPEVNEKLPMGRIPQAVELSLGRKLIYSDLRIESVNVPWDAPRTANGFLSKADVVVEIEPLQMLNASEILSTHRQG